MMTDKNMIADAAEKLFKDFLTTELRNKVYAGEWPATVWDKLQETGLVEAAVSEARGGTGLDISECCAIAKACGKYAAPVPLVEAYLAEKALASILDLGPGADRQILRAATMELGRVIARNDSRREKD